MGWFGINEWMDDRTGVFSSLYVATQVHMEIYLVQILYGAVVRSSIIYCQTEIGSEILAS